jgi:cytochrome c biogenesis protein CcdA
MEALGILGKVNLSLKLSIPGILALIAGILILLFRRLLNYLVGIYLIVVGLVLVFNLHF